MAIYKSFVYKNTTVLIWKIEEPEQFFSQASGLTSDIKSDKRRIEFLTGRYLLTLMIPGIDLSRIEKNEIGKPFLPQAIENFSISHSYPYVAVALNEEAPVGVDIQVYKEKITGLQSKFLSTDEAEWAHNDPVRITLLWSVKEALYKWKATGGQDFSEQLLIRNVAKRKKQYTFLCSILNEKAPEDLLELVGIQFDDFSFALAQ